MKKIEQLNKLKLFILPEVAGNNLCQLFNLSISKLKSFASFLN